LQSAQEFLRQAVGDHVNLYHQHNLAAQVADWLRLQPPQAHHITGGLVSSQAEALQVTTDCDCVRAMYEPEKAVMIHFPPGLLKFPFATVGIRVAALWPDLRAEQCHP
jgi:hypothetical protein